MFWYSLELFNLGNSYEHPQYMFLWRIDNNYPSIITKYPTIWSTVMLLITEIDHSKVVEKVQERNEQLIFSLKLEKSVHGSLKYFKNLMQLTFNFLSFYFCNITRKIL